MPSTVFAASSPNPGKAPKPPSPTANDREASQRASPSASGGAVLRVALQGGARITSGRGALCALAHLAND